MKRVIIYARVSTKEQNVDMQLIDLREYAKARKLNVVREYIDYASGSRSDRENYRKLFDDVQKRKTDVVLVWKFDRFARSTKELIIALEEFNNLGVDFISYKENIDTSTPAGKILFTMISAFAEFERAIIRERVKAGMEKAKARGARIGRPKIPPFTIKKVLELHENGIPYKEIIKKLKISKSTYYYIITSAKEK
ncbi:MAG: recombinase family protein [Ignavibacteriota bacterium]|nr:resolvase [Ignavibacteriota bacterium]MCO6447995.1 recombinase family protein [Ignavibacterium album]MCZ2268386.1 recombinase family protein [Ignavibacteriales bacterium]HOJ06766.1 recombinase family protein [Ignavibacteriaceae bacterium]MCZ2268630.1 recombinase family protein [Ignavibacteriales bacterium]